MTQLPRHFRQMHSNRALPRFVHAVVPRATRDGVKLVIGEFDTFGFGELYQVSRTLACPSLFHLFRSQFVETHHTLHPSHPIVPANDLLLFDLPF